MSELFIFLTQAVAGADSDYRSGARHALVLFATGVDRTEAQGHAMAAAEEHGWYDVAVERSKSLRSGPEGIADLAFRASAEAAMEDGASVVVYNEEVAAGG